jgi:hypothetical protein
MRKHQIALLGNPALEKTMGVSEDRLSDDDDDDDDSLT